MCLDLVCHNCVMVGRVVQRDVRQAPDQNITPVPAASPPYTSPPLLLTCLVI